MEKFFQSTIYVLIVAFLTLLFWVFKLDYIGLPLFMLCILGLLIFKKETIHTIPLFISSVFMVSSESITFQSIPLYLFLIPIVIMIGFIIHAIKYKVNLFRGKLLISMILFFIVLIVSTVFSNHFELYYLFYILVGIMYLFIYLFYRNTIQKNVTNYLIKNMVVWGIIISLQVFITYLISGDYAGLIEGGMIEFGWGNGNLVATMLILFIPVTFYYARVTRKIVLWVFIGMFETLMLLLTLSRGGILTFLFLSILLIIYLFKLRLWKTTLLNLGIFAMILGIYIYANFEMLSSIYMRFWESLFEENNNFDLYRDAYRNFLLNPIFGSGFFSSIDEYGDFQMAHNSILQTLSSFGSVGLVAFLLQLVLVFRIVLYQNQPKMIVIGISLLGVLILGLIENVYYLPQFMIVFLIIISVLEISNKSFDYFLEKNF